MAHDDERVTYFGETDARNKKVRFGIKKKDRSRHMYIIGKTGMGKSNCLENLAIQDIQNGEGLAFVDPHGKSADLLLEYVPEHRIKDVVYFAPFDLDYPISFNVLEDVGAERRHLVANGLMSAFKKIWVDAWSARMEYILSNILLALLEYPGSTLMGVNRMLVDKDFRKTIVDNISDPSVKAFWTEEYAKYTDKFAAEAAPAIQNKVGQFVANPLVRNIIGQQTSSFDIRKMMDEKKIFIVNLSKGRVGEANANLLGAMIITKIYLAAMSRADLSEAELEKSQQFYLYVDEFQSFANESFADILSEARKYKLNLAIAHQYIEQMTDEVRAAVFGNVGTMVVFRVGSYDAEVFAKEFAPQFTAEDIVNLQRFQMYTKLMIDTVTSTPFSAKGIPPIPKPQQSFVKEIIEASRAQFAHPRAEVEDEIRRWHIEKIQPVGGGAPAPASSGYGGGGNSAGGGNSQNGQQNSQRDHGAQNSQGGQYERNGPRPENRDRRDNRDHRDSNHAPQGDNRMRDDRPSRTEFRNDSRNDSRPDSRPDTRPDMRMDRGSGERRNSRDGRGGSISIEEHRQNERVDAPDRERQLREAVSLNYLKDRHEEEAKATNIEKDARPKNILALKEALLGILGEDAITVTPLSTPKPEEQSAPTANFEPQNTVQEPAPRAQEKAPEQPRQEQFAELSSVQVTAQHSHSEAQQIHSQAHQPHQAQNRNQGHGHNSDHPRENPGSHDRPHDRSREHAHARPDQRDNRGHGDQRQEPHRHGSHHQHGQNHNQPTINRHNESRDNRHNENRQTERPAEKTSERKDKEVDPESLAKILQA